MRALIVGGGVAGPAVAVALAKAGVQSVLVERQAADQDIGSYLTVAPNGLSALAALDVLDPVTEVGFPSRANVMYGAQGRLLGRLSLGPPVRDGLTALTLKRSVLAQTLTDKARAAGADIRTGVVTAVTDTGGGPQVTLADGTSITADLVIGADGVRSVVRPAIDPAAPAARYVGLTNFGGMTASDHGLEPQAWHFVFGRRAFFGAHPTPDGRTVWFVNIPEPAISRQRRGSIPTDVWRDRLVELTADDAGPAADLIGRGALELVGDNTHDLAHVPTWSRGRLVLVGDAVHAPSPSSGQGASMALEDAVVLGKALRDHHDVTTAFMVYEQARRRRVERIVKVGARTSSSKIPGPIGRRFAEVGMRFAFRHIVTQERTAWMTGHRMQWDDTVAV